MEPLTLLLVTGGITVAALVKKSTALPKVANDGEWEHPAPRLIIAGQTYNPTVSDGFKQSKTVAHRRHMGSDIDYQKHGRPGELPQYVKLPSATNSKKYAYFFPPGIPMRSARAGVVWWAGKGEKGHGVILVHGAGHLSTFYQHLESLDRPFKQGDELAAGTVLGPAGYNPSGYKFRHLHFEIRVWDPHTHSFKSIDPESVGGKGLKKFPIHHEVEL